VEALFRLEKTNQLPKSCWTVFNVENDAGHVLLVENLLARRSDLRLLTAETGNEGCEMALSYRPDTILMDIRLSDISGFEASAILRGNPVTAHIPVIALSSDCYPVQISKGLKAGFFRYLTKPYRLDDLMKAIDDALHHAARESTQVNCSPNCV
jgi:CheY-like chemotaxis protein